ncbi:hypothetical protein D9M71_437740 [compost metagenome]
MLDNNGVAVTATAASQQYLAITGSLDRRATRGGVIHAFVRTNLVQDRMLAAHGKTRADAGKVYRCTDERLAHAVAIGSVVAAVALLVGVAYGGVALAAIGKAGGKDIARTDHLAVEYLLFIDDVEFVTLADVLGEVDVIAENLGHIHRLAVRKAGTLGRERKRALDHAMDVGRAHYRLDDFPIEGKALGIAGQANGFKVADLAVKAGQLAVVGDFDFEYLAMLEMTELLGLLAACKYFLDRSFGQAYLLEQGRQGIATSNGHFAVTGLLLGRRRRSCGDWGWRRCRRWRWRFFRLGGGFGLGAVVDLRKGRWRWFTDGGYDGRVILFLLQLVGRCLELKIQGGFLGLYFAGGKHQQCQA